MYRCFLIRSHLNHTPKTLDQVHISEAHFHHTLSLFDFLLLPLNPHLLSVRLQGVISLLLCPLKVAVTAAAGAAGRELAGRSTGLRFALSTASSWRTCPAAAAGRTSRWDPRNLGLFIGPGVTPRTTHTNLHCITDCLVHHFGTT